jgi:chorismate mutase
MSIEDLTIRRNQIDKIDKQLIDLIALRFKVVKEISEVKKELNLPTLDQKRFDEMLAVRVSHNKEIDSKFIKDLFELIHKEALKLENFYN